MSQLTSRNAGTYPTSRVLSYGILGGFVGAIVMGVIALMMQVPTPMGSAPFFVAAAMMMGMGSMSTAAGWMLHLLTGVIVGAIFGVVVAKVPRLGISSLGKGLGLGAVAGIAVWVVFFMPMMVMLMPALTGMPTMVGGSFVAHVIFGLVLGGVTSFAVPKGAAKPFKCESCGQAFSTREELKEHGKVHMSKPTAATAPSGQRQEFKCSACGMSFNSEAELREHAQKTHPMPAR